jgi:hypothetical protein
LLSLFDKEEQQSTVAKRSLLTTKIVTSLDGLLPEQCIVDAVCAQSENKFVVFLTHLHL